MLNQRLSDVTIKNDVVAKSFKKYLDFNLGETYKDDFDFYVAKTCKEHL